MTKYNTGGRTGRSLRNDECGGSVQMKITSDVMSGWCTVSPHSSIFKRLLIIVAFTGLQSVFFTPAYAADGEINFPTGYEQGKHYAGVVRGDTREELFVPLEAIAAAKRGEPLPDGTVITMEDYRENTLYRYVVMKKRNGAGSAYPAKMRSGDWEFQWFNPDRTPRSGENFNRCRACHVSQKETDFVFTYDRMKEVD